MLGGYMAGGYRFGCAGLFSQNNAGGAWDNAKKILRLGNDQWRSDIQGF
jgi:Na+/H+-translocating membrane pyrophosphatase